MTMTGKTDDSARRAYWTEQMELGYEMVQKLIAFPVNECGERFASLPEAATAANVEMHFSTSKIAGDLLTNNPSPCHYGPVNWNPRTNEFLPVTDPLALLNSLPVIEAEIAAAFQRVTNQEVV